MAFNSTVNKYQFGVCGLAFVTGTYTSDGASVGGAIDTGMHNILYFKTNYGASAAGTANLNSISAGTVTITTVANETGQWLALGS